MSKYLLFIILLLSFTTNAQQSAVQKPGLKKINQSAAITANSTLWDEQEPYVKGFARVLSKNKFAFIDRNATLICPVELDGARNFSNHLAAVKKGDKWGFINETGNTVVPFAYEIVYDFNENVTAVYDKRKLWFINTQGEILNIFPINSFFGFKKFSFP